MLSHALRAVEAGGAEPSHHGLDAVERLRVTIIAPYGSEDLLVGAEQSYTIVRRDGSSSLRPQTVVPRQIRSHRERETLRVRLES